MSEVFPGTDLKCEEITMAVHRMQNLQLLSNTGEKCCKYKAECIWTHTIFYQVDLEVDLFLRIPEDLSLLTWICYPSLVLNWPYFFLEDFKWWKGVVCIQQGHPLHTSVVLFQDEMLFCDSCDRGFHMECCNPPLSRMPKGEVFPLPGFSGLPLGCRSKALSPQMAVWGCHSPDSEAAMAY